MLPVLAAAHLLGLTGLVLLGGGVWSRRSLTPAHPSLRWVGAGFVLILLGSALEVGETLRDLGFLTPGDAAAYLTETAPGRAALTRVLGASLLLAAELSAWPALLSAGAAAVLLWGEAGSGHGAAHGATARLLTALHAGAMTVWLGGVLALLRHPTPTADLARRFTPVALICVALLVYSGAGLTLEHRGTLAGLTGEDYGRALLLKLAFFALALLAAVPVRRAFARGLPPRPRLAAEALLLLAVLGVTAALGTTPPPTHPGHGETHGLSTFPGKVRASSKDPVPPRRAVRSQPS